MVAKPKINIKKYKNNLNYNLSVNNIKSKKLYTNFFIIIYSIKNLLSNYILKDKFMLLYKKVQLR